MSVGARIKSVRKRNRLTQAELAKKVGAHEVTIRTWENTDKEPNSKTIQNIAAVLNTTVAYLVGETDDYNSKNSECEYYEKDQEEEEKEDYNLKKDLFEKHESEQKLSNSFETNELLRLYNSFDITNRVELWNKILELDKKMQEKMRIRIKI